MPMRSQAMQPSTSSRMLVLVEAYTEGQMRGRLFSPFLGKGIGFSGFVDMVNKMDRLFDVIGFPKASMEYRSFSGGVRPVADIQGELEDISLSEDGDGVFAVHVKMRQNADWQGSVSRRGEGAPKPFNSTMELLKIVDEMMGI